MKNILIPIILATACSCNDSGLANPESEPTHAFSLNIEEYTFQTEIDLLNVSIFQQTSSNFYRLVSTETLDAAQIAALDSDENNNPLYRYKFKEGRFLVTFVGNYDLQLTGSSTPSDVVLEYPTEGLETSYYTAYQEIDILNDTPQTFNATLTRVISNPYIVVGYIPVNVQQIDFQITGFASHIDIFGNRYGASQSPSYSWIDTSDTPAKVRFTIFSILCFPSVGEPSTIKLTIHYRDGTSEIRNIPIDLAPNEYVSLFISFNPST